MKRIKCLLVSVLVLFVAGCGDVCVESDCLNGGYCEDGSCACPPGWTGAFCHIDETTGEVDPCFQVECLNGGECVDGTCDCPPGYTGEDCGEFDTAVDIVIEAIGVSGYPMLTGGSAWDAPVFGATSGPDPYLIIEPSNGTAVSTEADYNVTGGALYYNTLDGLPVHLTQPDQLVGFYLWDLDDLDNSDAWSDDDYMTGFELNLWDRVTSGSNHFPESVTVNASNGSVQMVFSLSYVFP
jgi:hypothetical protein